jgi:hypothetical protein
MMYPYALLKNPYPSAPTPGNAHVQILGGKRHKTSKVTVISCVEDMNKKIGENYFDNQFRLITVIHDVGSGKTHLALHLRTCKELSDKTVVSFIDLSQLSPRNMNNIYRGMLMGFERNYTNKLRRAILQYLREKAEKGLTKAKKIFNYGILDQIKGHSIAYKMEQILDKKIVPNYSTLDDILIEDFSSLEIAIIKSIIGDELISNSHKVNSLEDIVQNLSAVTSLNLKFLNKITIFEIDEFESDKQSMELVKAVTNAHLPFTLLLLILTPSSYEEIRNSNSSLFDRLENANYKIDLAGSNTLDEITDVVLEYIKCGQKGKTITAEDEKDLIGKIKILYDEFPDFRNIRSMINVIYHAIEYTAKTGSAIIDEQSLDETLTSVYPGLKVRESIMAVPVSDFMKIARNSDDIETLKSSVRLGIRDLVTCAYNTGRIGRPLPVEEKDTNIDITFNDSSGSKTGIVFSIEKDHTKSFEQLSEETIAPEIIDRLIVFTNNNMKNNRASNRTTVVEIDRHKIVDLIYFSNKYKNNQIMNDEIDRALVLAKSMKLL